jgi:hypothetical protein
LLSAGVLSNGQIRTPGPFRRGVLLSGGRRSAQRTVPASRGTPSARIAGCTRFYVPRSQPGQDHRQRALYRRHRWAQPEAEPLLRRPTLGRSAAQADCRRRPYGTFSIEERPDSPRIWTKGPSPRSRTNSDFSCGQVANSRRTRSSNGSNSAMRGVITWLFSASAARTRPSPKMIQSVCTSLPIVMAPRGRAGRAPAGPSGSAISRTSKAGIQ